MTDGASTPSEWLLRHAALVAEAARLGPVVDVACGRGRHTLVAAGLGAFALGIDRDADALAALAAAARARGLSRVAAVRADLETGRGLPLRPGSCGAVLVFRYLHRPLAPALAALLRTGGLLLYETFTEDQRNLGYGPNNADFLLAAGELRTLFPGLVVVAAEEGRFGRERPEALGRLAARRA